MVNYYQVPSSILQVEAKHLNLYARPLQFTVRRSCNA